jgi:large conductance mechanosensitive channel
MFSGFKKFIMRGNVIDLAVGVVIGGAFGAVVASLTKDLLTPLIAAIAGKPDFSAINFKIGETVFGLGSFLNAVVAFLLVAFAVYFFVVTPMNAMMERMKKPEAAAAPTTKKCRECCSEIPLEAHRCAHCTQPA